VWPPFLKAELDNCLIRLFY